MSLTPFARLQPRLNGAVLRKLADAQAVVSGGEPFGVIFTADPTPFDALAETVGPQASFELASAPGIAYGTAISIDGVGYRVVGGVEPDPSGWVTVHLEKA